MESEERTERTEQTQTTETETTAPPQEDQGGGESDGGEDSGTE